MLVTYSPIICGPFNAAIAFEKEYATDNIIDNPAAIGSDSLIVSNAVL